VTIAPIKRILLIEFVIQNVYLFIENLKENANSIFVVSKCDKMGTKTRRAKFLFRRITCM
jgi:hypothetical protein